MREIYKLILMIGVVIQTSTTLFFFEQGNIIVFVFSLFSLFCLTICFGLLLKNSYDKEIYEENKLLKEENEQFHKEINEAKRRLINAALKFEEK